jgi:hypothetical protein
MRPLLRSPVSSAWASVSRFERNSISLQLHLHLDVIGARFTVGGAGANSTARFASEP